jgi:hypothetical protein
LPFPAGKFPLNRLRMGKRRLTASEGTESCLELAPLLNTLLVPVKTLLILVLRADAGLGSFAFNPACLTEGLALFLRRPFPDSFAFTDFSEFANVSSGLRKPSSVHIIPLYGQPCAREQPPSHRRPTLRENCARGVVEGAESQILRWLARTGSWRQTGENVLGWAIGLKDSGDTVLIALIIAVRLQSVTRALGWLSDSTGRPGSLQVVEDRLEGLFKAFVPHQQLVYSPAFLFPLESPRFVRRP